MLKKRNLLFLSLLILGVLLLSSCFLNPPATEGILKGQIMVPEGSLQAKDLTGQALPDATVNILDLATGAIIATTTTDSDGHYQVSVPPGGPYLLEAVKDGVKLEQMTCPVEVGIEYDLGTADCVTTAAALIAQAMMDAGDNPTDIDCADIIADPNFDDVSSIVCSTIKAGQDSTTSAAIQQAVEDFLYPPAPAPTPTPTPTYTVTFNSQGGSAVNSQTVKRGRKVTEPTAPIKTGYVFSGWYKEPECITAWVFATDAVMANVTLYAQWISLDYYVDSKTGNNSNDGSADYPWQTIQHALSNTPDGGTIHVANGTYDESITFPDGKVITLQSVNGAPATTIIGVDGSATVDCNSPEGTTLKGFTITHNTGNSGNGILNTAGYLTIKNCTISNNSANNGGGIYNVYGTLTITGSTISNNSADYAGGGIDSHAGLLTITGSTIQNNSATYGGGIVLDMGTLTITGSTISGNTASSGGGIYNNAGLLTIKEGSIIFGNSATDAGGGIFNYTGTLTITGSTISGNYGSERCGGIYISSSSGTITIGGSGVENTICGNYKTGQEPSLDQQIGNISGTLYDTYKDTNYISAYCPVVIDIAAISGVTAPVTGATPVTTITETAQYTGTVTWAPTDDPFLGSQVYTATITLIPKAGFTLTGVAENFFTVADAGATNPIDSGVVTARFLVVGASYGGGIVAYILQSVDTGYDENKQHGLIAATNDQSTGIAWITGGSTQTTWVNGVSYGGTSTDYGTGQANTNAMKAQAGYTGGATEVCLDYTGGGYDDWFLPSKDELNQMYLNLKKQGVGGFTDIRYWSSSEGTANYAWLQYFLNGLPDYNFKKNDTIRVRPVRAF